MLSLIKLYKELKNMGRKMPKCPKCESNKNVEGPDEFTGCSLGDFHCFKCNGYFNNGEKVVRFSKWND